MTLFVLFGTCIDIAVLPKTADKGFEIANSICMFTFILDFLLSGWSKSSFYINLQPPFAFAYAGYIFSFFWFFDLLSIISLWPDIPWIAEPLGMSSFPTYGGITNASSAARIIRIIRVVRLIKIFQGYIDRRHRNRKERKYNEMVYYGEMDEYQAEQLKVLHVDRKSRLGSRLSEVITHDAIIVVIAMIVVLPFLLYNPIDTTPTHGIDYINSINMNPSINETTKKSIVSMYINNQIQPADVGIAPTGVLLSLLIVPLYPPNEYAYFDQEEINSLRPSSIEYFSVSYTDPVSLTVYSTTASFSIEDSIQLAAIYTMILTAIIIFLLMIGIVVFTYDMRRLILKPIENMIELVDAVAKDPLQPISKSKDRLPKRTRNSNNNDELGNEGQYETEILKSSLEKVTSLLRVGFGEAGAGIISANLRIDSNTTTSVINALLPGVRMYGIFGFCEIYQFEDISKALGKDVLTFVNTIADIVHSSTHTWFGQCNKNLGNGFVIVWRIGNEDDLATQLHVNTKQSRNLAFGSKTIVDASMNIVPPTPMARGLYRQSSLVNVNIPVTSPSNTIQIDPSANLLPPTGSSNQVLDMFSPKGRPTSVSFGRVSEDILSSTKQATMRRKNSFVPMPDNLMLNSNNINFPVENASSHRSSIDALNTISEIDLNSDDDSDIESQINDDDNSKNNSPKLKRTNSKKLSPYTTPHSSGNGTFKFKNAEAQERKHHDIDLKKIPEAGYIADRALVGFLKIIAEINRSKSVLKYRKEPALVNMTRRTPSDDSSFYASSMYSMMHDVDRTEEFKVRMGFGLHVGWAIEGAIGSKFKVDATYLSPHVNIAARLNSATRKFGVPILMSQQFHELLSKEFQMKTRQLDVVQLKGSTNPTAIYTYDCYQEQKFLRRTNQDYQLYSSDNHKSRIGSNKKYARRPRTSSIDNTSIQSPSYISPPMSTVSVKTRRERGSFDESNVVIPIRRGSIDSVYSDIPMTTKVKSSLVFNFPDRDIESNNSDEHSRVESVSHKPSFDAANHNRTLSISSNLTNFSIAKDSLINESAVHVTDTVRLDSLSDQESMARPRSIDSRKSDVHLPDEKGSFEVTEDYQIVFNTKKQAQLTIDTDIVTSSTNNLLAQPSDTLQAELDSYSMELMKSKNRESSPLSKNNVDGAKSITPFQDMKIERETIRSKSQDNTSYFLANFLRPDDDIDDILENDCDLLMLRAHITEEFMKEFNMGVKCYIQGDWKKACEHLEKSNNIMKKVAPELNGDEPSKVLHAFMKGYYCIAPDNWPGYRKLKNK